MAHIARLHHYLQGLMRHLQSQIQSMNVVVAEEEARSLSKKHKWNWRLPFPSSTMGMDSTKITPLRYVDPSPNYLTEAPHLHGDVLLLLIDLLARGPGHQLILHSLFFCTQQRWNTAVHASLYTAPLHLLAEFTLSSLSLLFTMLINPQIFHNSFFHFCSVVHFFTSCLSDKSCSTQSSQEHGGLQRYLGSHNCFAQEYVDTTPGVETKRRAKAPIVGNAA